MHQTIRTTAQSLLLIIFCLLTQQFSLAGTANHLSQGQDNYIPGYFHIYPSSKETQLLLPVTSSIRIIVSNNSITTPRIDYHQIEGTLVKQYISEPITLGPPGSGVNFLITWKSHTPTTHPIVESVVIGTQTQLGISFTSRGQALE